MIAYIFSLSLPVFYGVFDGQGLGSCIARRHGTCLEHFFGIISWSCSQTMGLQDTTLHGMG